MPYDPIEQKIIDALNGFVPIALRNKFTDPEWTIAIQAIFSKVGHQENCKVAANQKKLVVDLTGFAKLLQEILLIIRNGCTMCFGGIRITRNT